MFHRWLDFERFDLFDFWRAVLALVCTVYATVITVRSLWDWIVFLSRPDRPTLIMRQYVIVQLLRLRVHRFTGELLQIGLWTVMFFWLVSLHDQVGR